VIECSSQIRPKVELSDFEGRLLVKYNTKRIVAWLDEVEMILVRKGNSHIYHLSKLAV
jgi:hypothetical protein